jgi:hypothetical protein
VCPARGVRHPRRRARRRRTSTMPRAAARAVAAPVDRLPLRLVVQPAHPPDLCSAGGADSDMGAEAGIGAWSRSGGTAARAHCGHASRTLRVAPSRVARASAHRGPGSRAQSRSVARRIDASALHAERQSSVESASASCAMDRASSSASWPPALGLALAPMPASAGAVASAAAAGTGSARSAATARSVFTGRPEHAWREAVNATPRASRRGGRSPRRARRRRRRRSPC